MSTVSTDSPLPQVVLAIDPGTIKCGLAVVHRESFVVLHREVVATQRLVACVLPLLSRYSVEIVVVGDATNGTTLLRALRPALPTQMPLRHINEAYTTQRARARFHLENPPRGLMRLIPPGLRTPPRPYDDYVAVLLAEDYFNEAPPD